MTALIEVGERLIGHGYPCFVIAEIGVNHNGDAELAHRLIDVAADAGADAVKFQAFSSQLVVAADAPKADYQLIRDTADSHREMLARLALDEATHSELKRHADELGVIYFASPFDEPSVDMLQRLAVQAIKVPSGEITNAGLLVRIASVGAPILMSTGMSTLDEVDLAVGWLESARERLALFHCVSSYPAEPSDCNLRAMEVMRDRYSIPVGWSDHTEGIAVTLAAVALGADLIEKHLTLDRADAGPDHAASIEPSELRALVDGIRAVEAAAGEARKVPTESELKMASVARRSLHWRRDVAPDQVVEAGDLTALRPGTGIPPGELVSVVGSRTRTATSAGTMVLQSELESPPPGFMG